LKFKEEKGKGSSRLKFKEVRSSRKRFAYPKWIVSPYLFLWSATEYGISSLGS